MAFKNEIVIIFTVAVCTVLTRVFPFALFGRNQRPSALIQYIGKILPASIIAILIVYCLKSVSFAQSATFAPQFISVAIVTGLHIWKRNNLLSIGTGAVCYMLMIQILFR